MNPTKTVGGEMRVGSDLPRRWDHADGTPGQGARASQVNLFIAISYKSQRKTPVSVSLWTASALSAVLRAISSPARPRIQAVSPTSRHTRRRQTGGRELLSDPCFSLSWTRFLPQGLRALPAAHSSGVPVPRDNAGKESTRPRRTTPARSIRTRPAWPDP